MLKEVELNIDSLVGTSLWRWVTERLAIPSPTMFLSPGPGPRRRVQVTGSEVAGGWRGEGVTEFSASVSFSIAPHVPVLEIDAVTGQGQLDGWLIVGPLRKPPSPRPIAESIGATGNLLEGSQYPSSPLNRGCEPRY